MNYRPNFTITPLLLGRVEAIATLRERIQSAAVQVSWIPALQKDTRIRNVHSSTAIEGNPLTLEQVRAVENGSDLPVPGRVRREVVNYFAALRHIETESGRKQISHEDVFQLHKIIAGQVMDQGEAGSYRPMRVRVGPHLPPPPDQVHGLMSELLDWWNQESSNLSPVLSSAIVHHRFETIHPFADGNGRTGRALALWDLYRRGFDTHHIFSIDEFYWEDRPRYYAALQAARGGSENLTTWMEYSAEGLYQTLEKVWLRIQELAANLGAKKIVLRPRQEQLLSVLRARGGASPKEIWDELKISRQGAMDLLRPLIKSGLIKRIGTSKNGRYVLA